MPTDPRLAVSSFSLREQLGPIRLEFRDASGTPQVFTHEAPRLFAISDFPRRALEELGVDLVETVGFQFSGLDDPEIPKFEKALADAGVGLLNIALDMGDLADPDDGYRASDIGVIKQWIARFAAMGSRFVRVNPGSPFRQGGGDRPPAHLVAALVELGEFAQAEGARLLVENHSGAGSDPVWLSALLEQVGAHCGLLLDLGNLEPLMSGLRKATQNVTDVETFDLASELSGLDLTQLYEAVESLAPRAELVSVKTNWVADDGSIGAVDLDRALGILVGQGYGGVFSVEYEGFGGDPWAKTRRVVDATREAFAAAQAR
jgi:sugar phosphate isomerase/epimerase